jgi:GNAT superfamily N-acetyltransferase
MTSLDIRPLRVDEIDLAAVIFRRAMKTVPCFDETLHSPEEDRAFWREQMFPHQDILGAFAGQQLLGQVALGAGWIHHLHVDPPWQGRRVGSALVDAAKSRLTDIQLWTFQANAGARRFYERHGFIAMEFTNGETNEEREPDIRYRWLR